MDASNYEANIRW